MRVIVAPSGRLAKAPLMGVKAVLLITIKTLRTDRLLGGHGLVEDTPQSRREFKRRMTVARARAEGEEEEQLRGGWKPGAEDFADWMAEKLSRAGRRGERASERAQPDTALAQRLVREAPAAVRSRELDLALQPKGHPVEV